MIKHLIFRIVRYRIKSYLPFVSSKFYYRLFKLTYRIFINFKPSQLWVIILALLNKTEFKSLVSLPSILVLFNTLFFRQ